MDSGPALSMALRSDAGRLFAVLTDFRSLACHGWSASSLEAIEAALRVPGATEGLLRQVLPADMVIALQALAPAPLALQLPRELDALPLETLSAGPGTLPLGARFAVVRHLAVPAPGGMPPSTALPAPRTALPSRLRVVLLAAQGDAVTPDGLAALLAPYADLRIVTADGPWTHATGEWPADMVVCLASEALEALAAAPRGPALLCAWGGPGPWLDTILALRARHHAALVAPASLAQPAVEAALAACIAGCAKGMPPAEALRRAAAAAGWRLYHGGTAPLCLPCAEERPAGVTAAADDHRLITALSFDLVESTRLLEELGPERYSELLIAMHARCHAAVEGRGGVVDRREGDDGSMAWFGLPRALEDAAARALDAALDMQAAMRGLQGRVRLRIGIATGRVAVHRSLPFGTVLHLAARLRAAAEPEQVLVDEATRNMARSRFVFAEHQAGFIGRGLSRPVRVARLLGPCTSDVRHPLPCSPFVGREAELAELIHHWERAERGAVVEVLVHGEAGVGKTRLVQELLVRVRAMGGRCIEARGLPERQGQAFRTLVDALRERLGLRVDATPERQRALLHQTLPPDPDGAAQARLLEELLGVADGPAPTGPDDAFAARARERLLAALADTLASWAEAVPLLLLVEDVQWVDPSTRELLQRLPATPRCARLMLLCTRRDDEAETPMAAPGDGVDHMPLQRLSAAASRRLLREMAGTTLPPAVIDHLARRGDGVPLFLEASARLALESRHPANEALDEIPLSLQALLTARLDRLPAQARALAHVASVLGREFPERLLDAVAASPGLPATIPDLPHCRERLERAGVLRRTEAGGERSLAFRHELLRDAAYRSLWQRDRRQMHAVAADTLRTHFAHTAAAQPDRLAHHLAEAGRHEEAVALWEQAAKAATASSANREAIRHARSALACLRELPASAARDRDELRLQLLLGGRQIAAEGYGAREVQRIYSRAAELVDSLDDAPARIKVQLGLESVHVMRGELQRAAALARDALKTARAGTDASCLLQARWAVAHVAFHAGNSRRAVAHMNECLAQYRPEAHHRPAAVQDPGVMCLCYSAWALWEMGHAEEALRRARRVVALAQSLGHRFSQAEACGFAASVAMFRGETEAGLRWAEQALALCEDAGFAVWLAHARIVRGRLRAMAGEAASGLQDMASGLQLWIGTGAMITRPFYLAQLALTQLELGRLDEAERHLGEARSLVARTGERYYEAEVLQLSGRLALARGLGAEGEGLLRQALRLARAQGKPAFALRAALALAEHRQGLGHADEARALLEQALAALPEGHTTADPQRARALLAHWRGRAAVAKEADAQSLARP